MRNLIIFLSVFVVQLAHGYKLGNNDYFNEAYLNAPVGQLLYPNVAYPANRQGSVFDDLDDSVNYHQTLKNIETARAVLDSDEFNSDEFFDLNEFNGYDDTEIKADPRDEESESHSSLVAGHQYVSG